MDNHKLATELVKLAKEIISRRRVPSTPKELQLYSDMPGVEEAADKLARALSKAGKYLERELKKPAYSNYNEAKHAKMLGEVYKKIVEPVQRKYEEFGAADTEPNYVTQQYLIDIIKDHFEINGYTDLGDWM